MRALKIAILAPITAILASCGGIGRGTDSFLPTQTQREMPTSIFPSSPRPQSTKPPAPSDEPYTTVRLCPVSRELPLPELDFPYGLALIVLPGGDREQGLLRVGPDSIDGELIPNTIPSEDWVQRFEGESPDGKWFVLVRWALVSDKETAVLMTADGSQQSVIGEFGRGDSLAWISNNTLLVIGSERDSLLYSGTQNPFDFTLRPLPQPLQNREEVGLFMAGDEYYIVYYEVTTYGQAITSLDRFVVERLSSGEEWPVLSWLSGKSWDSSGGGLYHGWRLFVRSEGEATIVVEKPYGIDLATSINLLAPDDSSLSYGHAMRRLPLPGDGPNMRVTWESHTDERFWVDRYNSSRPSAYVYRLMMINPSERTVTDYCLDRGNAYPRTPASPDGRFLAWTQYEEEGGFLNPERVVVLDTQTGYTAHIDGVEFQGWGRVSEGPLPEGAK